MDVDPDGVRRRALIALIGLPSAALTISAVATQFVAWKLNYARMLGPPVIGHLYWPWKAVQWWMAPWAASQDQTFSLVKFGIGGLIGLGLMVAMKSKNQKPIKHPNIHGTAEFLKEKGIKETGLLPDPKNPRPGIIVGGWTGTNGGLRYLVHTGVEHVLCLGPTRSGKAQPLDSNVLTPTGFKQIGDLNVGDLVRCPNGEARPILNIYPQGEKEIYKVTFEDGRSVECCDDHLWKVWDWNHKREVGKTHKERQTTTAADWSVVPLSEIRRWFDCGLGRASRAAVPMVMPKTVELPEIDLPIPPYALGAILGDGSLRKSGESKSNFGVRFTTVDEHVLLRLLGDLPGYKATPNVGDPITYNICMRERPSVPVADSIFTGFSRWNKKVISAGGRSGGAEYWADSIGITVTTLRYRLKRWPLNAALGLSPKPSLTVSPLIASLRSLGLNGKTSHQKFIPDIYKNGSCEQRIALLQGLMDTDGSVGNGTYASFTSTSERLAKDVQEIAWSLGAIASVRPRQTYCTYKGQRVAGRPSWRVSIVHPDVSMMFSLPRKLEQCKRKEMKHRLRITSIEPFGKKPAACIEIDHPDHLYITDNYVVTHNTASALAPTLLSWPYSMVIYDPKGELWQRSSGWRKKEARNIVMRFAPADVDNTIQWNPFDRVRVGTPYEYRDVSNIIEQVADPKGKGMTDHWEPTAANFLVGVALYSFHTLSGCSLSSILDLIDDPANEATTLLKAMIESPHKQIAQVGRGMLNTADRERASIISTARRLLRLYRDPVVAKNTDKSSFAIEDLMNADRPVSLYVETRGEDELRMRPLIRLFLTLAVGQLISKPPVLVNGEEVIPHKWRMVLAIDELASLGELEPLELALSKSAGAGITGLLLAQDHEQIVKAYGNHETITSHCKVTIAFPPNNHPTAEWLSKACGQATEVIEEVSESINSGKRSQNRSYRSSPRALMTPDEMKRLKPPEKGKDGKIIVAGAVLILVSGQVIVGTQSLVFLDDEFKRRMSIPAPPTMRVKP